MAAIKFRGADGQWHTIPSAGPAGKSAYELAVSQGYTGTLAEWLSEILRTTDIANNLTTADAGKVLSALQGKLLNDALVGKQAAITSDNAASVRNTLGLKSGALLQVEYGSLTITAANGTTTTGDVTFDTAFATAPNIYVSMSTSQDPQYFSVCVSSQSESGFTVKVSSTFTAPRAINVQWLAIG